MSALAIELYAGLHGWGAGLIAEGFRVVGFDIVDMGALLGEQRHERVNLVIQDVRALHGSQFKNAALIVASPPCQEFSYMAMPWKRAKQIEQALRGKGEFPEGYTGSRTIGELTALFDACFRIQREANEANNCAPNGDCMECDGTGNFYRNDPDGDWLPCDECRSSGKQRYIPMVVENVRGAQKWVGPAKANFGSYYLWGDVGMVGKRVVAGVPRFGVSVQPMRASKNNGGSWFNIAHNTHSGLSQNPVSVSGGFKIPGISFNGEKGQTSPGFNVTAAQRYREEHSEQQIPEEGVKQHTGGKQGWFGPYQQGQGSRNYSSKSNSRKAASAEIARIPYPLAVYIARAFSIPETGELAALLGEKA